MERTAVDIDAENERTAPQETSGPQRRRHKRGLRSGDVKIEFRLPDGSVQAFPGTMLDLDAHGAGIEASFPLSAGALVTISSLLFGVDSAALQSRQARVIHCRAREDGKYHMGLCFDQPSYQSGGSQEPLPNVEGSFVVYYEVLQISPNADLEMIHRVYRLLAQRYHPDNSDSGNTDTFRLILQAYRVLSDPEQRAAYDVKYRTARSVRWKIFHRPEDAQGFEEDKRMRWGVLSALYAVRKRQPDRPGMTIKELEDLLGCPREHLEFSLWYLRGKSQVQASDQGRFVITPEGVDAAEKMRQPITQNTPPLLEKAQAS